LNEIMLEAQLDSKCGQLSSQGIKNRHKMFGIHLNFKGGKFNINRI